MIRTALSLLVLLSAIYLVSCEEPEVDYPVNFNIENLSDYYIDSLVLISFNTEILGYRLGHEPFVFFDLEQGQKGEFQTRNNVGEVLQFKAFVEGDSAMGEWIYPHHRRDPPYPVYLDNDYYSFGVIEVDTINDILIIGLLSNPRWD